MTNKMTKSEASEKMRYRAVDVRGQEFVMRIVENGVERDADPTSLAEMSDAAKAAARELDRKIRVLRDNGTVAAAFVP